MSQLIINLRILIMDLYSYWTKALKETEIVRPRIQNLSSHQDTAVPYIMLSASSINPGDTVVRKGAVVVQRPGLMLPPANPQFDGFEFNDADAFSENAFINFLIVRGVTMPSLRYENSTSSLEIFEGDLPAAVNHFGNWLARAENVSTGLIVGPEDGWQFSVLVYVCSQVARNAEADIRNLLKEFKNRP